MQFKIIVAAALLSAQSLSAQNLSPTIRNGILEKRVLAAVKDQNFTKAAELLEQMREMTVVQTPDFYYLDGRVQFEIKHYNASQQSLSTFLEAASPTSASFDKSLEILGEIQELRENFDSLEVVQICDYYQSSPYDTARPKGIDDLDIRSDTLAEPGQSCNEAVAIWADHPRMLLNWARRVPQSRRSEAIKALSRAADQGYGAAYFELGRILAQNSAEAEAISAAEIWLKKATEQGDPRAPGELGALYLQLDKTALAVHWLETSREMSYFAHNVKLAEIYLSTGSAKDFERAVDVLQEAHGVGNEEAAFALLRLVSRPENSESFQSSEIYSWSRDLPGSIERGLDSHLVLADALLAGEGGLADFERLLDAHEQASGAIQESGVSWGDAHNAKMTSRIEQLSANRFGVELCFEKVAFYDVPALSGRYPFVFLDQIDVETARPACQLAHDVSPDSPLVAASLARVEEAAENWEAAERLYVMVADEAFPAGYTLLGDFYKNRANNLNNNADLFSKSLAAYQVGSDLGAPASQLGLARAISDRIDGGKLDAVRVFRMVQKLAETSWVPARLELGAMYYAGAGVAEDTERAFDFIEGAARTGYRPAQQYAGYLHYRNFDYQSAAHWFKLAQSQGDRNAAFYLGLMAYFGNGSPKNYYTAEHYFAEAANAGHKRSLKFLGDMYAQGLGFPQDTDAAAAYYLLANDPPNDWAKLSLAELYFRNPQYPLHLWRAKYWLDEGNVGVSDANVLRRHIAETLGELVHSKVHYCDRFAAAPIDPAAPDEVAGVSLHDIDLNIVTDVCGKAIEEQPDVARFKFQLGRAYDASEDYALALEWYTKAAEQGHATAQFTLGWIYLNAWWIDRQPQVAVEWLTRAADQNLRQAKFHLGKAYYEGTGVEVDRGKGIKLLKAAVAQGDASARKFLEKLGEI